MSNTKSINLNSHKKMNQCKEYKEYKKKYTRLCIEHLFVSHNAWPFSQFWIRLPNIFINVHRLQYIVVLDGRPQVLSQTRILHYTWLQHSTIGVTPAGLAQFTLMLKLYSPLLVKFKVKYSTILCCMWIVKYISVICIANLQLFSILYTGFRANWLTILNVHFSKF
jgi:hypothetical protein